MIEVTPKDWKNAVKIIKAAKKLGVSSLKIGTLEVSFTGNNETLAPRPAFKATKKQKLVAEAAKKRAAEQLEFDSVKEEIEVMHVEDPLGFERAMIENDLSDGGRGGGIEETHDSSA